MNMKKYFALGLIVAAPHVAAQSVDYTIDCPNGGERSVTGEYAPVTGKFDLQTEVKDCSNARETVSNGIVRASGIFKVVEAQNAKLEAEIFSDMTRKNGDQTTRRECTRKMSGNYDMQSGYLDGESASSCDKSGHIYMPILEAVAGLDEQESLQANGRMVEPESKIVGTWVNCYNGPNVSLKIDSDGHAEYKTDETHVCEGVTTAARYVGICKGPSDIHDAEEESLLHVKLTKYYSGAAIGINGSIRSITETGSYSVQCDLKLPE